MQDQWRWQTMKIELLSQWKLEAEFRNKHNAAVMMTVDRGKRAEHNNRQFMRSPARQQSHITARDTLPYGVIAYHCTLPGPLLPSSGRLLAHFQSNWDIWGCRSISIVFSASGATICCICISYITSRLWSVVIVVYWVTWASLVLLMLLFMTLQFCVEGVPKQTLPPIKELKVKHQKNHFFHNFLFFWENVLRVALPKEDIQLSLSDLNFLNGSFVHCRPGLWSAADNCLLSGFIGTRAGPTKLNPLPTLATTLASLDNWTFLLLEITFFASEKSLCSCRARAEHSPIISLEEHIVIRWMPILSVLGSDIPLYIDKGTT